MGKVIFMIVITLAVTALLLFAKAWFMAGLMLGVGIGCILWGIDIYIVRGLE